MFEVSPRVRRGAVLAIVGVGVAAFAAACASGDDGSGNDGTGGDAPDAGAVADVATSDRGAIQASDAATNDAALREDATAGDDATADATSDAQGAADVRSEDAGSDARARDAGGTEDATADATSDAHESDAEADGGNDAQASDAGSDAEGPDSSSTDAGNDAGPPTDAHVPDAADAGCDTAPVLVNEVQTSGAKGAEDEWVELFNPRSCPLDISGFTLRHTSVSGTAIATVFTAGTGTILGAQGYGVIAGTKYSATPTPIGSFSTGVLADLGGGLGLYDASGTLVSSMGYGTGATNPFVEASPAPSEASGESIARIPNGAETGDNATDFRSSAPTPGAPN